MVVSREIDNDFAMCVANEGCDRCSPRDKMGGMDRTLSLT